MLLEMCISYMKTGNHILESQKRAELSALKSVFKFFSPEAHVFFGSGYDSLHESSLLSSHEKIAWQILTFVASSRPQSHPTFPSGSGRENWWGLCLRNGCRSIISHTLPAGDVDGWCQK